MRADHELLQSYSTEHSESAFAELVQRHATLVYAAALRQLQGDVDGARDVTQMVFTDLARKAASFSEERSLAGWLYTSARFAASKVVRTDQRRQLREQQAIIMNNPPATATPTLDAAELRPVIETALHDLEADDREAVLLRYFEGRDFKAVGNCLGVSTEAARKRVVRAMERLRHTLEQRGISSAESVLTAALSAGAALAIPANLEASVVRSALAAVTVPGSTAGPLLCGVATKAAVLTTLLTIGLGSLALWQQRALSQLRQEKAAMLAQVGLHTQRGATSEQETGLAEQVGSHKEHSELLRLRDEVSRLRMVQRQLATSASTPNPPVDPPPPQVTIEAKFMQGSPTTLRNACLEAVGLDMTGVGVTGILTEPQFEKLIRHMEKETALDILAAPRVTTLHNQSAEISVVPVSASGTPDPRLGPSVQLLPLVSADTREISLQATASLGELIPESDANGTETNRVRQTAVSGFGVLFDGQTLVLCQRVGRSANGNSVQADSDLLLMVFVTPTVIDPAGNRVHPQEVSQDDPAAETGPRSAEPSQAAAPVPTNAGRFFRGESVR